MPIGTPSLLDLEKLAPEWEELCSHCACTPFQTPQRVIRGCSIYVVAVTSAFLTARDGREKLIGIAPLFSHFFNGAADWKQISFLGAGVTDYLDFVVTHEYAVVATEAFLWRLMRGSRAGAFAISRNCDRNLRS